MWSFSCRILPTFRKRIALADRLQFLAAEPQMAAAQALSGEPSAGAQPLMVADGVRPLVPFVNEEVVEHRIVMQAIETWVHAQIGDPA